MLALRFVRPSALLALLLLSIACRPEPLPVLWISPSYQLVDQHGRSFGSSDLVGRASVVSFIYTHCTDTCPLLTATMAEAQRALQAEGLFGSHVQFASVTVDPARDSPPVLAEYAGRYHADPEAWRFLTGEPEAIYGVLEGFKLTTRATARAASGQEIVVHSNRFVVMDARGRVRALLPGEETRSDALVTTIRRVMAD